MEQEVFPLSEGAVLHENYQIQKVIGAGGFGITYIAWDRASTRHVVIKECLPVEYAVRDEDGCSVRPLSDETSAMFNGCIENTYQEAQALFKFSHPGVVQIFDLFAENGTIYYVMEYIEGKTLHDLMMEMRAGGQALEAAQLDGLLVNILDILESLHNEKIYHCDIKPGNIFITTGGMPKLIDFGAVRSKELQHQGLVQITPGYTPPEFYPGRLRELGPWSDIYELGATFYELLTGLVPEPGDQRFVRDRMVKVSTIDALSASYPMAILSSIDKALEPDFRNRFNSVKLWKGYLDNYQSGRQIRQAGMVQQRPGAMGRGNLKIASSLNKKKSGGFGIWLFIILLLLGGAVWYMIDSGRVASVKDHLKIELRQDTKGKKKSDKASEKSAEKVQPAAPERSSGEISQEPSHLSSPFGGAASGE